MKKTCGHVHFWSYPHAIWEGRTDGEVAVIRYCGLCGKAQLAHASDWGAIPKGHDAWNEVKWPMKEARQPAAGKAGGTADHQKRGGER